MTVEQPADANQPFPHGRLRERIQQVSALALASGHLQPLETWGTRHWDHGVSFAIRVIDSLARKPRPKPVVSEEVAVRARNPFLPFESALYVSNITESYVGVLNKFKVVDDHLLLITRRFESQCGPLGDDDFLPLAMCLVEMPSLGFYNSGPVAGASQPHRHLQLVPLPLDPDGTPVPVSPVLCAEQLVANEPSRVVGLPFGHWLVRFEAGSDRMSAQALAERITGAYRKCVARCGWTDVSEATPYNFLVTREWFLFVPRRVESIEGISLNAMAFVGGMLVANEQQLSDLKAYGPMRALIEAARPAEC